MFEQLLEKVSLALDKVGIPYMVIGGQAVLLYGEPRLTRDIDITLGTTLEKLDVVLGLVEDIGLESLADPETFTRETMVLPCQDTSTSIRIDFIFSFSAYEKQALERVQTVKMGNAKVAFASVEDLIIHKVIAGRPRDLEDVESILIKNPEVDSKYIRRWLKEFAATLKEPFLKRFNEVVQKAQ
jgi:predicted nucleotidyltransferase